MLKSTIVQEEINASIRGKRILVTGGTGSFGKHIVKALLAYEPAQIVIYSRDEEKQYFMQHDYRDARNVKFVIGDVRDPGRVDEAMRGMNVVFHAAAIKQVPAAEKAPYEAVLTNVYGSENLRRSAIRAGAEAFVAISTDKAVKPVNVMGMTKAIQERILLNSGAEDRSDTRFVCVRYGNVLGSRGSVVPLFAQIIKQGNPLTITSAEMTRFLLTLTTAVELVFHALVAGTDGQLWVRKMPGTRVTDLARLLAYGMTGREDYPQKIVGVRPGEKIHEILISEEEMARAEERDDYFAIHSPHVATSGLGVSGPEYASNLVEQLTDDQIYNLLKAEGWF